MKRPIAAAACSLLAMCLPSLSAAAIVHSDYVLVAGNTWTVDFTIVNDGSPAAITGFTIYFPEAQFANLSLLASPSTWDTLLIPPDALLPADGFLDSFVLDGANAIGAGASLGGFRVRFDHAGGVPQALAFDINDASFNVLFSGTTVVTAIPEPASHLLAALAVCAAFGGTLGRRTNRTGQVLAKAA